MRITLLCTILFISQLTYAVEGMWLPQLLEQLNIEDMKSKGCKLSADDIYNINKPSLKDAIVSFGGFCTGEIVSDQGLVLTNHHCGFGQIQAHSSVQKDYLTNGFWAMDQAQELPNKGLFVTFIVRIEDVTSKVLNHITTDMTEELRAETIKKTIKSLKEESTKDTHYEAVIKPFFEGLKYYMFITETYNDVRLVGAPPETIGKFGGDTDNWKWPRHTGDFSLFRIYADSLNRPAAYNSNNVPYQPKRHLKINTKGADKNDFTMVFGFPGRTNEYLPSYAIDHIVNTLNPARIKVRESKMDILTLAMKNSDEVRIQYAHKYARLSNYYKKWKGENRGITRFRGIERKQQFENQLNNWINTDPERKIKYEALLPGFKEAYASYGPLNLANEYIWEALYGIEILAFTKSIHHHISIATDTSKSEKEIEKSLNKTIEKGHKFFKNFNMPTDMEIFSALSKIYVDEIDSNYVPDLLLKYIPGKSDHPYQYIDDLYVKSAITKHKDINLILKDLSVENLKKLKNDPLFQLIEEIETIRKEKVKKELTIVNNKISRLKRLYMQALFEFRPDYSYYPNANSTLRVSYGQIDDYSPSDGIKCKHYTTLKGVIEKYNPDVEDFKLPQHLIDIYKQKGYDKYLNKKGQLPVAFTASNHTTGGNSGSPILNAKGELIGLNFDRNWEGTMSDIMYDPDQVRNISVDVRYILFIIEFYAGAEHLVAEMNIIN